MVNRLWKRERDCCPVRITHTQVSFSGQPTKAFLTCAPPKMAVIMLLSQQLKWYLYGKRHSEFPFGIPGTQNSPFLAMEVGVPLPKTGFTCCYGVNFGEGVSVLKIKTRNAKWRQCTHCCLDWEERLGADVSGRAGLGGRESAEQHGPAVSHHFFPHPLRPLMSSTSFF